MTLEQMISKSILTKTPKDETIDVVFKGGRRATYSKLLLDEHMDDDETERIIDNATGEIIYINGNQ